MSRILLHKMHKALQVTEPKIAWGSREMKTHFLVLQNGLANVPCHRSVVKKVCSQLIKENVFDYLALEKFLIAPDDGGNDDLYGLVLMFMNR